MANDDDDDIPCLSVESLKALQEFIAEQTVRDNILQSHDSSSNDDSVLGTSEIEENWQLSQFWYDDKTAEILANEICRAAGESGNICLISCPTLYKPIKKLCVNSKVKLLEFDKRFSVYGTDFVFYDYKDPQNIPSALVNSGDIVVLDPPFLSEECLEKTATTAKLIAKDKIILCTGAVMDSLAKKILNVNKCKFEPKHTNNLGNKFCCFANYNFDGFVNK